MARPAFSRLPVAVNLPLLLQALAAIEEERWQGHFNSAYYKGDWSGVALISAADALTELAPGRGQPLCRLPWSRDGRWQEALRDWPLDIAAARLLRLGPGAQIHEHRDYDLGGPDGDLRLHVPLLSPPEVDFWLDGQRIPMTAGECWYLDLSRPHRVDNRDTLPRVHLVLDCRPGPWLEQLICEGLPTTPAARGGQSDFMRFQRQVEADPQLARTLQGLQEVEAFIDCALEAGARQGLHFTREELRTAMRDGRRQWSEQWKA
ncbi:Aspartyl/Asparaginyl beta-hydroxylase [Pseudomonas sp. NFACC32-1]|uniref:aspartyl/asparaginyl beta-hydroxylase domain-containing protein n=1 Tax=Pseudomonas TaxID=286 RepID=UPI0008762F97|nr:MULTISPECIES: aspartyl/asparaginyl beta-hydroxylase domain-containing protein [Pseudomonas]MDT8908028.1 aspartyl/asparaginyl beta-hydroxylase domain-containing protein [Pseudomonas prosekii]NHN70700.1 aspartyl beta-hydroxylase [Pseudomonas fluorescens]ROO34469.1 aspartyl beta-hydroxylase [Pseudomonas sp. AF76]SCX69737.1 Aspartyl/Asparaginyl beta-hydroxylase [Pseudomonas sp. NFACC32-1]SFW79559.1 Aspartyl/Asparaginyl beta-hydroxylase [Pseudomonas sp. NFACC09-4]